MLQKYKLPVIVKPSKPALLHLFIVGFFLMGFQACRISDFQSFANDDAYFSLSDLPQNDYVPLSTSSGSLVSDTGTEGSMIVSERFKRDAFGNLIISSGIPALDYEDYYDYSYSSRIRRFGSGALFPDYFSSWYTEHYWFSHEVNYWGTNIYETTPWNWYGMGSSFQPNWVSWWLNSGFPLWNWPNNPKQFGFWGHASANGNVGTGSNSVVFRKRKAPTILNSSFSGFSYSGRPSRPAGTNPDAETGLRPSRPVPTAPKSNTERVPEPAAIRPTSTGRSPVRVESAPANSATRFDNRKENGLIREEPPASNSGRVSSSPATNSGRKASFGEGSRSVPRAAPPAVRSSSPAHAPVNRTSPPVRSSGSVPQKSSSPPRSTPSGQRPR
ncbi:MAG: hypothetical protein FJZ75_00515 [Bacteroidetes bacterium]|nr:hypothetical protein [Bacteroidota bacterium]